MYVLNTVVLYILYFSLSVLLFCLLQHTVDETNKRICKITGSLCFPW